MPQISPFHGLRFNPAQVGDIGAALSPPYDVISPTEQQQLLDQSPFNIVRVELSRDEPDDSESTNRYTRAADLLRAWRASGALIEEPSPSYYLLAHTFEWDGAPYTRRGLFAAVRLHPWSDGQILPHEETFSGPKEDRLKLLNATQVNVSPVFMVLRQQPSVLSTAWSAAERSEPAMDIRTRNERQQLWVVNDAETLHAMAEQLDRQVLYIADGHHRYETALRYRDELMAVDPLGPAHPAQFVLSHIATMDDPGLLVLPTHRLVKGVHPERVRTELSSYGAAFTSESINLENPESAFDVAQKRLEELGRDRPAFGLLASDSNVITLYVLNDLEVLKLAAPRSVPAWRSLDVSALQTLVLDRILPTHHERDASITYARDPQVALDAVRSGICQVAFLMNTPSVRTMADVADARARMPEKSTYFYPKVTTGLVMRSIA
ncbi:MAG: DUF1015 domain-containing protein [Chloroflexota bacterium]